jgi:hypothetical protein
VANTACDALRQEILPPAGICERISGALLYVDVWDAGDTWRFVDDALDSIYRALKRDPRFTDLSHDQFDALIADTRQRAFQELAEKIDDYIAEVERAIDRELGDDNT